MTRELTGRRIVVPEGRELGQLIRMLEEHGAEAIPCPMIAIRDAPDAEPVAAWLRRFADVRCDDLVLMTGEGLRRLLGFARRVDLETKLLKALGATRKITTAMRRLDLSGRYVGVQLNPGTATDGFHRWPCQIQCFPMSTPLKSTMRA